MITSEPYKFSRFSGVKIDGIASCVPEKKVANSDLESTFGEKNMRRFGKSTGILERRVVTDETALDLCIAAARELERNGSDFKTIEAVIFVSQTPDYVLPASAIIAQDRLGIPRGVPAFDVGLGCSGYVYGMWLAASLISSGAVRSVLLLAGDTISKTTDNEDRSTRPIFGDAGTATIIATSDAESVWSFAMGSDGSGSNNIIIPNSLYRQKPLAEYHLSESAIDQKLYMDGQAVFNFTATVIPNLILELLNAIEWRPDEIDNMYLHQANDLILKTIARKTGIGMTNVPSTLSQFGNTSCASIPLAMTTANGVRSTENALLCGFGVGLSWGAMAGHICGSKRYFVEGIAR
ncbi:ketoacyl-ACP synthase III [Parasphingorhabdus flavimaris]|uniref:ketoacyl-ACP synthase III n=1 Tax=Parasphingorhabdus flavimaris TaxID=266812 RepID=UPI0030013122